MQSRTWEDFKKLIEEEFIPNVAKKILNGNFELNKRYQQMPTETEDMFTVEFWIE